MASNFQGGRDEVLNAVINSMYTNPGQWHISENSYPDFGDSNCIYCHTKSELRVFRAVFGLCSVIRECRSVSMCFWLNRRLIRGMKYIKNFHKKLEQQDLINRMLSITDKLKWFDNAEVGGTGK